MNALLLEGVPGLNTQPGVVTTEAPASTEIATSELSTRLDPTLKNIGNAAITLANGLTGTEVLGEDDNLVFIPTTDLRESVDVIPDWIDEGLSVRRFVSLDVPMAIVKWYRRIPPGVRGLWYLGGPTSHRSLAELSTGVGGIPSIVNGIPDWADDGTIPGPRRNWR